MVITAKDVEELGLVQVMAERNVVGADQPQSDLIGVHPRLPRALIDPQ